MRIGCDHMVHERGRIEPGHLIKTEIPEFHRIVGEVRVVHRPQIPATVAEPHVVPSIRQYVGQRLVLVVEHPRNTGIEQTVLQDDRRAGSFGGGRGAAVFRIPGPQVDARVYFRAGDAKDGENVAVLGLHIVGFEGVALRRNELGRVAFSVGIGGGSNKIHVRQRPCDEEGGKKGREEVGSSKDHHVEDRFQRRAAGFKIFLKNLRMGIF